MRLGFQFTWAVLLAIGLAAARAEEENPWRIEPKTGAELSTLDRKAREELLALLERRQSPKFRKAYRMDVPRRSSGVGSEYRLLVYGHHVQAWGRRLSIQVAGEQASAELLTDNGIFRGELPFAEVDLLTRQLAYGFQATETLRKVERPLSSSRLSASHAQYTTAEIEQTKPAPLHLHTPDWQLIGEEVDESTNGVRGFVHKRFCERLLELAYETLKPIDDATLGTVVVLQLQTVSADRAPGKFAKEPVPVTAYQRTDLAATEAVLLANLAVKHGLRDALPELERLGDDENQRKLQIVAADDPAPLLRDALRSEKLYHWAQKYAFAQKKPEFCGVLIDWLESLPANHARYYVSSLIGQPLTAEHIAKIVELDRAAPDALLQTQYAALLLDHTKQDEYFERLMKVADGPPPEAKERSSSDQPWSVAATAVFDYSARTGRRREDARQLLLRHFEAAPAGDQKAYLLWRFNKLGSREDLPLLERSAEAESGHEASNAVNAIAEIDPPTAVRKARERITKFAERGGAVNVFSWNVSTYYDLIFWQDDRASIEPLLAARATRSEVDLEKWGGQYDPLPLIRYLEEKDPEKRLQLALAFVKAHTVPAKWQKDVAERFIAAGADREKCRPLLEAKDRER